MESKEVRQKFLDFFKARGHAIVPSASLVPENDPTTLFTGSGMQPMIPYLLGAKHPLGARIADAQKSFRAEDIDEVGDNRHTTFFEMLGNWSFGDPDAADRVGAGYWKEEQLSWLFEFLTKEIRIPEEKLWVTCFDGNEKLNLPRDNESAEIWKGLGIPEERIRFYGSEKNWWSRSGPPESMPAGEPGGPDSEIFYDFGAPHDLKFGKECHPNCDCGRFLEIGNSVFMEYKKKANGSFEKLAQRNVDFGGGLERITAAANDEPDVFKIDVFSDVIEEIEKVFEAKYRDDPREFRIVSDHFRAAVFMIADGVVPSNKERGYLLRRLIRRASYFFYHKKGDILESQKDIARSFIEKYGSSYPDLKPKTENIILIFDQEIRQFYGTLETGLKELDKLLGFEVKNFSEEVEPTSLPQQLKGDRAFVLFSTYGLPLDLIKDKCSEMDIGVDEEGFWREFKKHQELSRTASAGMFKGGLADHSEKTTRLHTAHHLLLKALQAVLGPSVKQRGSNITSERLRMDFSYDTKMTDEQKKEVERIVNEQIAEDVPVIRTEMAREDAEKLGAEREFGQKYPERVSVYSVGPKSATPENPQFEKAYSIEFCGGPHVARTGAIGKFRITKEEAVSAGVRRIRGVLE
ncbi:MAG: alanine--tRNA ligase [Candidatus Liptonbacteria bacterium]|nr:alanine--tRNA ligase [Candidatus Liptonbacteria bacterium]